MWLKALFLWGGFLNMFRRGAAKPPEDVEIGDLPLSPKLLKTSRLSAESKLTYAYVFFHRNDVNGFTVRAVSDTLKMPPWLVRNTLQELERKHHIRLITAQPTHDSSELVYYYNVVDPRKYGMLDLEKR